MKVRLQELEHQRLAVQAVTNVFEGVDFGARSAVNPEITSDMLPTIQENVEDIQGGRVIDLPMIPPEQRMSSAKNYLGLDVRMETGTGKTYVFTRTMYELHARYGFNKFILLTPSAPIREGTSDFIRSDYADEHFRKFYDSQIVLQTLAGKPKHKQGRRRMIPPEIREYAEGADYDAKRIDALIMTGKMLQSPTLSRDDYDQTLTADGYDSSRPLDILARTRPVVIIDEPHRFARNQATFKKIVEELQPGVIIRYGATFPRTRGTKTKPSTPDYENLVYELNSAQAFNNLLVKGVKVQYPDAIGEDEVKLKVTALDAKEKTVTIRNESTGKSYHLDKQNNLLGMIHPSLSGILLENVGKSKDSGVNVAMLSNGAELPKDYAIMTGSFSQSYQETMLEQALANHFKIERDLFERERKIKPSTLFFIDSIHSYRGENNDGWLKVAFERKLRKSIEDTITEIHEDGALTPAMQEYLPYLEATLQNIEGAHGGYFAEDLNATDEQVTKQVQAILRDKNKLMSFRDERGHYNVMRFIFSKWTLREGWDLPTVFQIVKMRSSGSENSKLQEVGRGLRLPVDEYGNRVTADADQFFLTYLVDFTEREFADQLVDEINADTVRVINVNDLLADVAKARGVEPTFLMAEMLMGGFIEPSGEVKEDKLSEFLATYHEFATGVNKNRIRKEKPGHKEARKRSAKIRPSAYERLRSLWETLTQKYVLLIQELSPEQIDAGLDEVLQNNDRIFVRDTRKVLEKEVRRGRELSLPETYTVAGHHESNTHLPYGEFLKRAHTSTALPVDTIHRALARNNDVLNLQDSHFNIESLNRFLRRFHEWFDREFATRFEYAHVGVRGGDDPLTKTDGSPKDTIERTRLGRFQDNEKVPPETYLYDVFDWDSPIERDTIMDSLSEKFDGVVEVFGKIPTRSIKIPTYSGQTTSPDFMYVIKRKNGRKSVNFVAETKGMDEDSQLRGTEVKAIAIASKFFEQLRNNDVDVYFTSVLNSDGVIEIIEDLYAGESVGVKARTEADD